MSIKVKHEGNATSRIVASAKGGRGKRQAEDAKLLLQIAAQEKAASMRDTRGGGNAPLASAHAQTQLGHAPTMGAPSGIHATPGRTTPTGARAAASSLAQPRAAALRTPQAAASVSQPAPRIVSRSASVAPSAPSDYKVTGTSIFDRPDEDSQWDPGNGGRWVRPWLPGEKEAEAQQRIGDVKNAQEQQMYEYRLSAQQKQELAQINDALESARRSGRYTPQQLAELERQADARRLGIKPLPTPAEEPAKPNIQTDADGNKWIQTGKGWERVEAPDTPKSATDVYAGTHLDANGVRWGVDKSGKLYEVGSGQKDDFAALMKLVPDNREEMQKNPVTGEMKPVSVPLTMEEKLEYLKQLKTMRDQFNKPPAPPPAADPVLAARTSAPAPAASNGVEAQSPYNIRLAEGYTMSSSESKSGDGKDRWRFISDASGNFVGTVNSDGSRNLRTPEGGYVKLEPDKRAPWEQDASAAPTEEEDEFAKFRRK